MFRIIVLFGILAVLSLGAWLLTNHIVALFIFAIILLCEILLVLVLQRELQALNLELNKITLGDLSKSKNHKFLFVECKNLFKAILHLRVKLLKESIKRKKNNYRLKLKNLQNTQILSSLCHEFKNPISIILGYCDLIDNSTHKLIAKEKIQKNAKKLDMILNRLILATQLEADLIQLEISTFSLKEMIEDICHNLSEAYPTKNIYQQIKDYHLSADRILIESAISNLIENALKYSTSQVKIILKNNTLKIIDDGKGFGVKEKNQITKKFYRLEQGYKQNSLGLGLFITKYILKLHTIELKIKSQMGKGSNFSFKIPKNLIV